MPRVVVYGSDSGLRVWADAIAHMPGWDATTVTYDHTAATSLMPIPVSSLLEVRRAARGADAVLALSSLLGTAAHPFAPHIPTAALDVGLARAIEMRHPRWRRPMLATTRGLSAIISLSRPHALALAEATRGRLVIRTAHQPIGVPTCRWNPDRYTPYVLCVGSSGRDLAFLNEVAKLSTIEVRLVEGGHEMVPARGTWPVDGFAPSVIRYGSVPYGTYVGLLRGASALVLPLLPVRYPVGLTVLLEAVAAGVPVIATSVPAIAEYLGADAQGLVEPGDSRAMADLIARASDSSDSFGRGAESARVHALGVAAPPKVGQQLATVLNALGGRTTSTIGAAQL